MFWDNFVTLCNQKGKSPNGACAELGFSANTATKWKQGSVPRDTTLRKIADYFGVTVDELLAEPARSPVEEAVAKLTASIQDAVEKQKTPSMLERLGRIMSELSKEDLEELGRYADYLASKKK